MRARLGGVQLSQSLAHGGFPPAVAACLLALASSRANRYAVAVRDVLVSFETRGRYLEDIPVADTVIVLQRLAEGRDIAVPLSSALLPARA